MDSYYVCMIHPEVEAKLKDAAKEMVKAHSW